MVCSWVLCWVSMLVTWPCHLSLQVITFTIFFGYFPYFHLCSLLMPRFVCRQLIFSTSCLRSSLCCKLVTALRRIIGSTARVFNFSMVFQLIFWPCKSFSRFVHSAVPLLCFQCLHVSCHCVFVLPRRLSCWPTAILCCPAQWIWVA
jgi:hypothetical protein